MEVQGEFVHGIFYGVIWPDEEYADEYRQRAIALDAHRLVWIERATIEAWARSYCLEHGIDRANYTYDDIVDAYLDHVEETDDD